ncbi:MAG: hypothetical protein BGO08_04970 [Altererythrobacter sp. 66-12]|nr:MAG: hypothetical protein BGO08_04970 [Altererythrobacter sp. 66-12]
MVIAASAIDALVALASSVEGLTNTVAMSRKTIRLVLAVLLVLFLALAWFDGGREPQRLMEQPVDLPPALQEAAR